MANPDVLIYHSMSLSEAMNRLFESTGRQKRVTSTPKLDDLLALLDTGFKSGVSTDHVLILYGIAIREQLSLSLSAALTASTDSKDGKEDRPMDEIERMIKILRIHMDVSHQAFIKCLASR